MKRISNVIVATIFIPFFLAFVSCSRNEKKGEQHVQNTPHTLPSKLQLETLPNAIQICDLVISGGLPVGDAAFADLQKLGIRTIISVDGAKPDVAIAEKFGMRYVHLPHGYDGISDERALELTKAVHDLSGPFYVHCHHGKHRSPAAAVVACVGNQLIHPAEAKCVLEVAGTSPSYRGLHQSAADALPIDESIFSTVSCEFSARVELPPMAEAMVEIEAIFDRLSRLEKRKWQPLQEHPNLVPAHEALLLKEQFVEMDRLTDISQHPPGFADSLKASVELSAQLEHHLLDSKFYASIATDELTQIKNQCTHCHQKFRDVPLQEKQLFCQ